MPSFLLKTNSSQPDADVGCRVAYVELTPKLAKLMLKRIKMAQALKKEDSSLYQLEFWDGSLDYLTEEGVAKVPEKLQDVLDQGVGFTTIPKKFRDTDLTEEDFDRTECDIMLVRVDGVSWTAMAKHTDINVTTEELPLAVIKAAAKK